ncbi:MAG: hypothetical protein FJY73_11370 [Candidatus Eisenbacteria bacterium]|nr:hypothetical protein [Candidatus Eisenbacteria bacterium]
MKIAIVLGVLVGYFVLAFAIARFCAVNAGWERAADLVPPSGGEDLAVPERKALKQPERENGPAAETGGRKEA